MDVQGLIGVNVDQFFGIEIEEFPAQIAQVALWLVDHQMNLRVSVEFGMYFARIPLISAPGIRNANALRLDWKDVLPAERCSYVLGNPPFIGKKEQTPQQKAYFEPVMNGIKGFGVLDFVAAWYIKAARYIGQVTPRHAGLEPASMPRCAFVSTNSITQGEQVGVLWGWMLAQGVHIQFAHRTFSWSNEAKGNAAVHCVIVGFGLEDRNDKIIFEYADIKGAPLAVQAKNINPYLVDGPFIALAKRNSPICKAPLMTKGSEATDFGYLVLSTEEKSSLIHSDPKAAPWIRKYVGGDELINNQDRWCLWLKELAPAELRSMPLILDRIHKVKTARLNSGKKRTKEWASMPSLFSEDRQPSDDYLAIPKVSSERRLYLPISFVQKEWIASGSLLIVPNATLHDFGVLNSSMHMAWTRQVCGRLESRYQYSASVVYNNYPWPGFVGEPLSDKHRSAIEQAAQCVLDARTQFPGSSLADLYDPLTMPLALLKAHQKLDTAVDAAYQSSGGKKTYATDAERVAFLFDLYQRITSLLSAPAATKKHKAATKKIPSICHTC